MAHIKGKKFKVQAKGEKQFVIPPREAKELDKRGKFTPPEKKDTGDIEENAFQKQKDTQTFSQGVGKFSQDQQDEGLGFRETIKQTFGLSDKPIPVVGTPIIIPGAGTSVQSATQLAVKGLGSTGGQFIRTASVKDGITIIKTRSFIGRGTSEGLKKVNPKNRGIAKRYGENTKSKNVTKGWLLALGVSLFVADKLIDAFGSYPWAGHNAREATDTLVFPMRDALAAGDLEGYDILAAEFEQTVNEGLGAISKIPFLNVIDSSELAIKNAIVAKKEFDRIVAEERGEIEFEALSTGKQIAKRDAERDAIFANK